MKQQYRTVQEYLRSQEIHIIAHKYCMRYDKKMYELPKECEQLAICDIKKRREDQVVSYLKHLLSLTPKENEDHMIFYAQKCAIDQFNAEEVCVLLSSLDELVTKNTKAETYGCFLAPQEEVLGFYLSEDPFTKRHMDDVIQDILYEMSYFGWQGEERETVVQELREIEERIENGTLKTVSRTWEELWELCGIEPEEVDPHEEELTREIRTKIFAYNDYHREKQMKAVISQHCQIKHT